MNDIYLARLRKGLASFLLIGVIFLLSFSNTTNAQNIDFEELRERLSNELTGLPYNSENTIIKNKLTAINNSAVNIWSSLIKTENRTTLWSDINFSASADITEAYSRLQSMAIALKSPGCSSFNNNSLKNDLISALDWMYENKYSEKINSWDNWWDFTIGSPQRLNNIVIVIYNDLSQTQITNYMNAVDFHCNNISNFTAANLAWVVNIIGSRAIIVGDAVKLLYARDSLLPSIKNVTISDGFYEDGSFIQHDKQPYNGGYGLAYISTVIDVMQLFSGTEADFPQEYKDQVLKWIYSGFEPLTFRGAVFCFVRGRDVARSSSSDNKKGRELIKSLSVLRKMVNEDEKNRLSSYIKYMLTTDATFASPYDGINSIKAIVDIESIITNTNIKARTEYPYYHQYASMDRAVMQRPGYAFGIAMHSTRVYNFEMTNNENLKGWFSSAGATYLYNAEDGQYSSQYWPTVDAYKLAGTTVPVGKTYPRNRNTESDWTGGTSLLNQYGVSGMYFNAPSLLGMKAKKSWFIFDNEIVAIGSDITNSINAEVNTYIEQRRLSTDNRNTFTVNGNSTNAILGADNTPHTFDNVSWAHLTGKYTSKDRAIGYYFPEAITLKASRKENSGTWRDINITGTTDVYKNYFLTFWKEHGNQSINTESNANKYSYVILPGFSSSEVHSYSENPDIQILSNTASIHAVKEKNLNLVGINFWENNATQKVEIASGKHLYCDKKASIMFFQTNDSIVLSVSDPTQSNTGNIKIVLDNISADAIIEAPDNASIVLGTSVDISVNVQNSYGKTHQIILKTAAGNSIEENYSSIQSFYIQRIAENELICCIYSTEDEEVIISFFDSLGRVYKKQNIQLHTGSNSIPFSISDLPKGLIFVQATVEGQTSQTRKHLK